MGLNIPSILSFIEMLFKLDQVTIYLSKPNIDLELYFVKHITRKSSYLCFLLRGFGASSAGLLKMSRNMGSNFLYITVETAKFLSSLSTLSRNSWERLAMSDHFFILLKNWIKLKENTKWILTVYTTCYT